MSALPDSKVCLLTGARVLCSLAILDSVRVPLPDYPSPEPIVNIASITVRQNALWVEVYDEAVSRFRLDVA